MNMNTLKNALDVLVLSPSENEERKYQNPNGEIISIYEG